MAGAPTPRTIGRRFRRSFTAFQRAGGPLSLVLVFGLRWNLRVKKRPAARQPGEVRRRLRCPIPSSQPHPATSASRGEHLTSAGRLPLLGVLGAGQPRPLRPAGHVRELGEHLTSAGRLPGLVPWPSSWCSPAAVDLASAGPLPRLDVLGTGRPRPLRPAGYARELGEHLADAGPLPLLDVPGTGRPRPLRPAGYARELGEHLADAGPLPLLDVLGAGQPRPLRLLATSASWASTRPTPARCHGWTCSAPGSPDPCDCWPRRRAGRAPGRRRPAAAAGRARHRATPTPAACCPRQRAGRAPGRRRPAAAAGRARRRAAPTPAACSTQPATSANRASTWPAPTRCRCWTCSAPGSPDRFGPSVPTPRRPVGLHEPSVRTRKQTRNRRVSLVTIRQRYR